MRILSDASNIPPGCDIHYKLRGMGVAFEPPPEEPFEEAVKTMTPMAASFYSESKRVSNARIREELGVELAYPDYRSGLAAILAAETA